MFSKNQDRQLWAVILVFIIVALIYAAVVPSVQAVLGGANSNWAALPPYNTLWPLWSPALSPINAITGLPTPIVSNLAPTTVLPVQPGLTWDPSVPYPWLLYNTPIGMAYYDPFFGINLWPPSYLTLGPIALPPNYATLPPTNSLWISTFVPLANALYLASLPKLSTSPVMLTTIVPPIITPVIPIAPFGPPVAPLATPIIPLPPVPATSFPTPSLLTPTAIL